jgi:hypothetical protein
MNFADELRNRLNAKQSEWEKCREEVRIAKEKETRLRDEISALQVLLSAEDPKARKNQGNIVAVPLPSNVSEQSASNKVQAVRSVISEHASVGINPPRIIQVLEQKGIQVGVSYIYGILARSKKAGVITERNGRYYPVEKEKAAS